MGLSYGCGNGVGFLSGILKAEDLFMTIKLRR